MVQSKDKTTHIDGSQIKMYDGLKRPRLVMGYNPGSGSYEFSMFNKSGVETLLIDENGNAVFTGRVVGSEIEGGTISTGTTINVGTDATIGKSLKLKDGSITGGCLSIYDGTTPTLLLRGEGSRDVRISTDGTIELSASRVVNSQGRSFITEGYSKMYVTVGGVDYPVKFA